MNKLINNPRDLIEKMEDQKELVHEFIEQDEFMIIILDACRPDYLQKVTEEDVEVVLSVANRTKDYIKKMWPGYYDLVYYSSIPYIGSGIEDYKASKHFREVVPAYEICWNEEKGTVMPSDLTELVIEDNPRRSVVHFCQPHYPYVGEYSLEHSGDLNDSDGGPRAVGEIYGHEKVRRAYESNLKLVLEEGAKPLKENFDLPMVITADHGESLGEQKRVYGHGYTEHLRQRLVGWKVVQ